MKRTSKRDVSFTSNRSKRILQSVLCKRLKLNDDISESFEDPQNDTIENNYLDVIAESPLPPDANIEEINSLMDIFEGDSNPSNHEQAGVGYTSSSNLTTYFDEHNEYTASTSEPGTILLNDINESTLQLTCSDEQHHGLSVESPSVMDDNLTPHPSPDCELNHLDFDCTNHYCPWYIENQGKSCCENPMECGDSAVATPYTNSSFNQSNPSTPMSNLSTPRSARSRKIGARKDKGNLRRKHMDEWIDVKRKRLNNLGKQYQSRNGIIRPGKVMGDKCSCRMKCFDKISENERNHIFNSFWELGDRNRQWEFISKLAVKQNKRRVYTDTTSRRNFTIKYKLPLMKTNEPDMQYADVCKKMFLATFSVSDQFVFTSLEKVDRTTGILNTDQRGRHNNHRVTITNDVKTSVCNHIKSLQPVESHYLRKKTDKLYLDGDLNFKILFKLYNEWFDTDLYDSKAQTIRQYRDIVNQNFKISFYIPKKDQCDQCHIYRNLDNPTAHESEKHELHIKNKKVARDLKSLHKKEAKNSDNRIVTASFDFQKVLNSPYGQISVLYYKRKLSVFNFTVFSLGKKEATCFMWHEGQAKRGANEVSSCLLEYILSKISNGCKDIRFWSDNCIGQNRNRIVYVLYMYVASKYKIKVKHCFLEKGHTQAESDSVHALIERSAKNKTIYTPSEWYSLVRWAKQNEKPYIVKEMDHSDFSDFKSLLLGRNWAKNINGDKVEWNKIKEVFVTPEDPYKLNYKYDLSTEEYMTIAISSNTRRQAMVPFVLKPLYRNTLPIPKAKKDDLINLCVTNIIPKTHHIFYETLCAN